MAVIDSTISTVSDSFAANRYGMLALVDKIRTSEGRTAGGHGATLGGADAVDQRQHAVAVGGEGVAAGGNGRFDGGHGFRSPTGARPGPS